MCRVIVILYLKAHSEVFVLPADFVAQIIAALPGMPLRQCRNSSL